MPRTDEWQELCRQVELDDGLYVRPCGKWTEEKLWFWHRYVAITTRAMVGKPEWSGGLVYVDLFCGPGICKVRDTGRRLPGSPLIAANSPKPFTKILLCDLGDAEFAACELRMKNAPAADRTEVFQGDCNAVVGQIASRIPQRSLTLALIDPEGLDFSLQTLRVLTAGRQVDLLILFADAMDALRNAERMMEEDESRLDSMLGPNSNWRERWTAMQNPTGAAKRHLLQQILSEQICQELGYIGYRQCPILASGRPIYRLIYASKHAKGLEFWDKSVAKELGGQGTFGF